MSDNPFSQRPLGALFIESLQPVLPEDGGEGVVIGVNIYLARPDGKPDGPHVRVDVMAPLSPEASVRDARHAALERVLHVLRRIGEETPESLNAQWEESFREAAVDAKNSISLGDGFSLTIGGAST
ncbi:hypothetical protein QA635_00935 [Bradyrhizobium brasilense]|uniref:hypothetical protein n=1 Tax=Bradyrhizobium brasilense TaxID=1419277 RepID=UPI0024B1D7A8|nr:hypothetical protein [Bradyrhizobium australafricanum]WFU33063.1 hypothetical protein QA635_00935 [Bradyrhizobium australafricanum]